jgi:uncharacterized protein (TIGR02246 family)
MRRKTLPPPDLHDTPEAIEAHFYEALALADTQALMQCFADDDEVFCIHPGGPRLVGLAAIRAGFEQVFADTGGIVVQLQAVHAITQGDTVVRNLVAALEIQTPGGKTQAFVSTTNVFVRMHSGWRIIAHHVSPASAAQMEDGQSNVSGSASGVLH